MDNTKDSADNHLSWHRKALLLILAGLVFRSLYSIFYPVHLAGDEAYYWDWGRRPALGYYSKPPFIAWLYGFVDWINGSLFSIRFTAILLGSLTLLVNYYFTRKLFDIRTGFLAVLIGLAVPGNCLLSFILTIDAPLMLAWALSLLFFWKYLQGESPRLMLLLLFLALGVGHLSKPMMAGFPILALIFLVFGRETRQFLKKPGPWLALVGSFAFYIPPFVIWNSQNNWITFKHMKSHAGAPAEPSFLKLLEERASGFGEFVGTQLGALSPVFAVCLFALTVVCAFKRRKQLEPKLRYLVTFCGLPLLAFLVLSIFQKVQANWPAPIYLAGIPMVAAWFSKAIDWFHFESDKSRKNLLTVGLILGFLLGAFFYFGPVLFNVSGNEGHKLDPNRRLIGSDRFAAAVQEVREQIPDWQDHFILAGGHRYQACWLAFELPDRPRVYKEPRLITVTEGDKPVTQKYIESQYEVWPGPWDDGQQGKDAIFIATGKRDKASPLVENAFDSVTLVKQIEVKFGIRIKHYTIFRCQNFKAPLAK